MEQLPCPSQHVVLIPLFPSALPNAGGWRGSQQGGCLAHVLLASSNSFPLPEDHLAIQRFYMVCLAGSLLPFPATGVFHTGLCKVPLC